FMPRALGTWTYQTQSDHPELAGATGEFICIQPDKTNHGPVRVQNTYHFAYEDGTPFKPITTTSYGWVFQADELEEQTLTSLTQSAPAKPATSIASASWCSMKIRTTTSARSISARACSNPRRRGSRITACKTATPSPILDGRVCIATRAQNPSSMTRSA